ncbi:CAF1 domain-containing protein [Cephalotus follicularis]|uniref:poly(A)-specific ribonuclease n=1 Tax=Cephalotus follicularis TaxID=3775 RepID=A0A1Q3CCX4_CEPFO|nr:CAF1 domain-containing protein [Cephalotus follicularis]
MTPQSKKPVIVRQVWADNLEFEISQIKRAIPDYPFVAMDTEFPGTIFEPYPNMTYLSHYYPYYSCNHHDYDPSFNYFLMKSNVDVLNIIQLGLSLSDSEGNLPCFETEFSIVWEFNFRDFNIDCDPQNIESIRLLERQGIDFKKNKEKGINSWDFAKLVLCSGLVLNSSKLTWVTFHSSYDFGFLIKILTRHYLPCDIDSFMQLVVHYFGYKIYDIKHMIQFSRGLCGGLERVAKLLHVERKVGKSHQAGSDSLLTMQAFLRYTEWFSKEHKNDYKTRLVAFEGMLYGLERKDSKRFLFIS